MTKGKMNPRVDFFFAKAGKWEGELEKLRMIVLNSVPASQSGGLKEELKWGVPCYTFQVTEKQKSNIVLIHAFKDYCAVLFFKGALVNDTHGALIRQTKNVQAARQMRFTSVQEVVKMGPVLQAYIREAIGLERSGSKVEYKKASEYSVPTEFQNKLDTVPALKKAFEALTPGRQRGYLLYFSQAKLPKTREARVEKHMPQILKGKGLDD